MNDYDRDDGNISTEGKSFFRKRAEKRILKADQIHTNDVMLAALVVIAATVSFTDFSFSLGSLANITALTVFLYIVTVFVYRNRYAGGIARGKKETEYTEALSEYRKSRGEIYEKDLAGLVPSFCTAYKKRELREYRESLLCDIDMSYDEYSEKYLRMTRREILREPLSLEVKRTLIKCNSARSVKLMPGMILNENGEFDRQKLIGKSGRQRERTDKRKEAISRAVYVLFGALIAFDVIFNFSLQTILMWAVRMLPVILAMITGDDEGYCNITVTEVAFKKAQVNVINLFNEWVKLNKPKNDE